MDSEKRVQIRKRNEEMIKFWSESSLVLILGLFGGYWIVPGEYKINLAIGIILGIIIYLVTLFYYSHYHEKTTGLIRED